MQEVAKLQDMYYGKYLKEERRHAIFVLLNVIIIIIIIIRSVSYRPLLNWSYNTHSEAARSLLGSQLSDALGLERSIKHYLYVKFILFFMMCFQYIISYLNINYNHDSKFIKRTKIIMRSAVNKALKKY